MTSLTGSDFNLVNSLTITVGGKPCLVPRTVSPTELTCLVAAGEGKNLPIVVNGVKGASNFSYCAPVVNSIQILSGNSSTTVTVLLTGTNLGQDVSFTTLNFRRPNDVFFTACTSLTLVTPNTAISCVLPVGLAEGEYFYNLTVAGIAAVQTQVSFTIGQCYTRQGIDNNQVVLLLQKIALQKNIEKLVGLLDTLKRIKASLPTYDGNDCCAANYAYPLPLFELEWLTSISFDFKDCIDSFCSQRESYLAALP